ncbi:hypothetical protein HK096_006597 [Nowakowskiella sp. JEL0078]|nr:hypothetical protein HK096_006597 [Nowakowskiella sp. JEL0078]
MHGNVSGIDNTLCTFGGAKSYTNKIPSSVPGFTSVRFLLINTKVPKDTKVQVEKVRNLKMMFPNVVNPLLDSVQAISDSCIDFFSKYEEVSETNMQNIFGNLVNMNHSILCALGVSHPKIEFIRQITMEYGLPSKLTGAGGGGCVISLVPSENGFECYDTSIGCNGVQAVAVDQRIYKAFVDLKDFSNISGIDLKEFVEQLRYWHVAFGRDKSKK